MKGLDVVHHTLLRSTGGATRVADMLHGWMTEHGGRSLRIWELDEQAPDMVVPGYSSVWEETLRNGGIVHLHSTRDWLSTLHDVAALCAGLPGDAPRRIVLTMHDCSLITGGCVYPLDCTAHAAGCPDPCPRDFPASRSRYAALRSVLALCRPTLVSPSRWLKKLAQVHCPGHNVHVIPNGVPWAESLPSRAEARKSIGVGRDARLVLFVAHGGEKAVYKGGRFWKEICSSIRQAAPGTIFLLAGGDEHRVEGDTIHWPYVDSERLRTLMVAADMLVYPTLADNHPLLVLEAMAAQCPVVAWNTGGLPEQILSGKTGLLAPERDVRALVDQCLHLLDHPAQAKRMRHDGYAAGSSRFTVDRMAADYLRLYSRT